MLFKGSKFNLLDQSTFGNSIKKQKTILVNIFCKVHLYDM